MTVANLPEGGAKNSPDRSGPQVLRSTRAGGAR